MKTLINLRRRTDDPLIYSTFHAHFLQRENVTKLSSVKQAGNSNMSEDVYTAWYNLNDV